MKQIFNSAHSFQLIKLVVLTIALFFTNTHAIAADCDLKGSAPSIIQHDLSSSYCELCGYGYVTIKITTPYSGADMSNMTVVEDLGASGLTYASGVPNDIRYKLNGVIQAGGTAPLVNPLNHAELTWNTAQFPPSMSTLASTNGSYNTIEIIFAVKRDSGLSLEALATIPSTDRQIRARLDYSAFTSPPPSPAVSCGVTPSVYTSWEVLPLHEPLPRLYKGGRNVDAAQTNYTSPIYGNNNDDIVWQIEIRNTTGTAAMQDVRFDDAMLPSDSMLINYACPTENAALTIANANGAGPGALGCVAVTNTVNGFVVSNPFGNPGNTFLDVPSGGSAFIYLVGKIVSNGSCISSRTNTASNLQWGCEGEGAAGGLVKSSAGTVPAPASASLTTLINGPTAANLQVQRTLSGINGSPRAGSKGTLTITITNTTGGSIKNIKLRDILPSEYVMDSTAWGNQVAPPYVTRTSGNPAVSVTVTRPANSSPTYPGVFSATYPGMIDTLTWTNPVADTVPLTSTDPSVPLSNTAPEFSLTSGTLSAPTSHSTYSDQANMLRNGDSVTISFRVVLIKPSTYDKVANLDVLQEDPSALVSGDPTGTDPSNNTTTLSDNRLYVTYENFESVCTPSNGGVKNAPIYPYIDTFSSYPEDLDVRIIGGPFILTDTQILTIPVRVNNNANATYGHSASNYHLFFSFGATMKIENPIPSGCVPIAISGAPPQPAPWKVWTKPVPLPTTATVYHCDSSLNLALPSVLARGASTTLNFNVSKNSAGIAADDLTMRADVVGEVMLTGYPPAAPTPIPLWFPTPTARADLEIDRANNYSLDGFRQRLIGFNLTKTLVGNCSEYPKSNSATVEIGEECTYQIKTGNWFGFLTPGFTPISVQNVTVTDELPTGAAGWLPAQSTSYSPLSKQGFISEGARVITSEITGVSLNLHQASPLANIPTTPLAVGWLDWKFNQASRITNLSEQFQVNFTSRLLNDPLNQHGGTSTNVVNSTFEAVFTNPLPTSHEEIYTLGHAVGSPAADTVGYPQEPIRRVILNIAEPAITLTKTVCNETLSITKGEACSPFVASYTNADSDDNFIYRINVANASGADRAPAYDVVVTDLLDTSDKVYVEPFETDLLNNDGDATTIESNEGAIFNDASYDNVVNDAKPVKLEFSYTHSTALKQINPGSSVNLYYRVDPDKNVQPGQTLTNNASAAYDSLYDPNGAQTIIFPGNNTLGGARIYTSTASANIVMATPTARAIEIISLSNHTSVWPLEQPVSVGEEVKYRLRANLPITKIGHFVIRNELPVGVRCKELQTVNLTLDAQYSGAGFSPGGAPVSTICNDTVVEWDFGVQTLTVGPLTAPYTYDFYVDFIARIENTANTNNNDLIVNGYSATPPTTVAYVKYTDSSNVEVTKSFPKAEVRVQEPKITLTKVFSQSTADAADTITVTVSAANNTAGNLATAYNLKVRDDFSSATNLSYAGSITSVTGLSPTASTSGGVTTFSWPAGNAIVFGETRSFSYKVVVATGVQPLEIISNNSINPMQAKWDSLPGSTTALNSSGSIAADGDENGLRNGVLPNVVAPPVNDYQTTPVTPPTLTVPPISIIKTDESLGVIPAIGEYKNFKIVISLPEGSSQTVKVEDNLAVGTLSYLLEKTSPVISYSYSAGIASVNGGAAIADPTNSTGIATWDFGTVVTSTEDDNLTTLINPTITINYSARVDNAGAPTIALPTSTSDGGDTLSNSAEVTYRNGSTGATATATPLLPNLPATAAVSVVEPLITLSKSVVATINGATAVQRFTLVLTAANGALNSTAFDATIRETLSAYLTYFPGSASFTVTGGATVVGSNIPTITGQVLTWGNDIDIPKNATVTLIYDATYTAGYNLTSTSFVQWTSLNGVNSFERDGSNAPTYNDYFTTLAVNTPPYPDVTTLSKLRLSDTYVTGDSNVRIGDVVNYQLTVHLSRGTTLDSKIVDVLPQGLEFLGVVSVNGDSTSVYSQSGLFTYTDISAPVVTGSAASGSSTVTWTLGDITNADTLNSTASDFVIEYQARILNGTALAQLSTQPLINNATFYYIKSNTTTAWPTSSVSVTVQQPILSITKTAAAPAPHTNSTLENGDVVTYTIVIINNGSAPAYDIQLQDVIPAGMRVGGLITSTITPTSYNGTTGVAIWNLNPVGTPNAYTILAGGTLTLVYTVRVDTGLGAGVSMSNLAQVVSYCSFDDEAIPVSVPANAQVVADRKCYAPTPSATPTTTTAIATVSTAHPNVLTITGTPTTAIIGEPFTYRITIPAPTTDLFDVNILDDLRSSSPYVDISNISVSKISGPAAWVPSVSGTDNLVISGSNAAGLDIPAGQIVELDVTVRLNNSLITPDPNPTGKLFHNTATYSFHKVDTDAVAVSQGTSVNSADITIIGPDTLIMDKTGPPTMQLGGAPAMFTLDVLNPLTNSSPAWDVTIEDILPNTATGGMCGASPTSIVVQNNATTLTLNTDYTVTFVGASTCKLTLTMTSAAAAIAPNTHLKVTYFATLDTGTLGGAALTNKAAAIKWFGRDSLDSITAPANTRTYAHTISSSTPLPTTVDFEDDHTVNVDGAVLSFLKSVQKRTSTGTYVSATPPATANPGDWLRYTLVIQNKKTIALNGFSMTDELDRLNDGTAPLIARFAPNTLTMVSVLPAAPGATITISPTGLLTIQNLSLAAAGGADTVTIVFDARLAPVITHNTVVRNQAQIPVNTPPIDSDDPNINGTHVPLSGAVEDKTQTLISSSPNMQVRKTSLDLTGDPLILMAGDRLRYTITVKNIGTEDASGVTLRDLLPANTTYVTGSTKLNGVVVADVAGLSALQTGMSINPPEIAAGVMAADATVAVTSNVATITFEVQINSNVLNGSIISNQGFVNGSGLGSGAFPEKLSDDPATATVDDPTLNIVGNLPLLNVQKTVAIQTDIGSAGIVDAGGGDVLRYTITLNNIGAQPATGVALSDTLPLNTAYVSGSLKLNGLPEPDGTSLLVVNIPVSSPASTTGTIAANTSAVVSFDVQVNNTVALGDTITNQGSVTSNELPTVLTDADGNSSNGFQPTTITVGSAQQVQITKQVSVVGGGPAVVGGDLEYLLRVTNTGTATTANLVLTDDLNVSPLATQVTYVTSPAATINGAGTVVLSGPAATPLITATYGDLLPGATAQLRFRVKINSSLALGTTITNTGKATWIAQVGTQPTASVSIDVGGVPGSANLNGYIWHDANFDNLLDTTPQELVLSGWTVGVYRNNVLLGSTTTDASGMYKVSGLAPSTTTADQYILIFSAPGAVTTTAKLGRASSSYTNSLQQIADIPATSGGNLQNLNMPIHPNGILYNSILRTPVTGESLTMLRAGSTTALPTSCFDDPAQQGQITLSNGYYKFDMNFGNSACPAGGDYLIQLTSPLSFMPGQSKIITPLTDALTTPFSVATCPGVFGVDAITATGTYCESQALSSAPPVSVGANSTGTNYYLRLNLNNPVPEHSQIFNNHIPVDPKLDNAVTITKVASLQNVTKGQIIPYTITVSNTLPVTLTNLSIVDTFPSGFKYVPHSGRMDGVPVEPVSTTRDLTWRGLSLATNTKRVIQLMLIVGSGVKEGKYVNRAQVFNDTTGGAASPLATATVRVIPDPTLDCSDVIGKVFDDVNLNGYQDEGEMGLPGVRVVTARGLLVTADKFGRFHLTCAVVPDPDRGSNFILKVDDRTLPSGYRMTTENPRVLRATRGKMLKFNFGAAIHKVVKLDMADGVFEPGTTEMRVQWKQRIDLLLKELRKSASVLRLSYLAETESESLVNERLNILKHEISSKWKKVKGAYDLNIESEVFWRNGSPP
jgi:uncharacterized repeat protein (TIGR01451 family)/fimbrial isopeptide formation D2 family protein